MKTKITLLALLFTVIGFAQQGINYKAIIKDDLGNVVANDLIQIQFNVLEGVAQTNVYSETHSPVTDTNGMLIVNIGEGTPISGIFSDINWGNDDHFLNVEIDTAGGTAFISMGTTQFMTVPYAIEAANVTGLIAIDEGNGIGYRIKGRNPDNYGNVGKEAIDLSYRISSSLNDNGATGSYSTAMGQSTIASGDNSTAMGGSSVASNSYATAMGQNTTASGYNSTAMGSFTVASGNRSIAMGNYTTAPSISETVIGILNTDYTTSSSGDILWNPTDRLFTVGNGQYNAKSDALIILKNGTITAPSLDIGMISNNKTLITKEYLEATTSLPLGLEKITENANSGWRLIGQQAANYGNIGDNAIDLSFSNVASSSRGATGDYSVAIGRYTTASGDFSTSLGFSTIASGDLSLAMGLDTTAPSFAEIVMGQYNTDYTPNSTTNWNANDRIFTIGNGYLFENSNALTVLKNGTITAPSFDISEITDNKALITKEYGDTRYLLVDDVADNGILNGPLTIQNASDANSSWRLETRPNGGLSLYRNGNYRGFFSESTGNYSSISDRRTKKDIKAMENGTLNKVLQLNPVSYLMKDQTDTKRTLGLISQEVQEIFPSITTYIEESDLITLSYTELIPILIKALQEQQKFIEKQNIKLNNQDSKIINLTAEAEQKDETLKAFDNRLKQIESLLKQTN